MEAYCVKCKTKREISNPEATFTSRAVPATKGQCPVCGTNLFRMGRTEAHEGLTPPPVSATTKGKSKKKGRKRKGRLVIVESPAKARTIKRYLGKGYTVKASYGHVRDLLRSQLSVDVDNNYTPKYRVPNDKRAVVKELKADAAKAEEIFLATDLDREGEAIAWHLIESAEIEEERVRRVIFHEITRPAIQEAFHNTREINMDLVDAQRARRILDRLVGYSISPLLWAKVRGRLSAGRVQSAAVRLIVDREREIEAFVSEEYWSIYADLNPAGDKSAKSRFRARLHKIGDQEVGLDKAIHLHTQAETRPLVDDLEQAVWAVVKVKEGERRRKPPAPFTTSTMQQDAARRLNFTARKTMRIAQQLYEGIDVGGDGPAGLITYMRTDSVNVSALAVAEVRDYIREHYGKEYVPATPPKHKTKAKSAQEAHEAIRPTSVLRNPKTLKSHLSRDQHRLYQLIWQRFVASQMTAAVFKTVTVDIHATRPETTYLFRATGSRLIFKGFIAVYKEVSDEDAKGENGNGKWLPPLRAKQPLDLYQLLPEQHFTQPPPRYTEASLVKTLEEHGIGRPSTYAPIISTIQNRGYVVRDKKRLYPTEIGTLVNDLLVEHFSNIVDLDFTANMESELDKIAGGNVRWQPIIDNFWQPFVKQLETAREAMPDVSAEPEYIGRECPQCGNPLIIRHGRYGKFIGCSNFPTCKHTEPWLDKIGVICPNDGGELVERKTRKGRTFYGCANYPECEWTSWQRPLPQPCPLCSGLLLVANKTLAKCTNCGETTPLNELEHMAEAELDAASSTAIAQ